MVRYDVFLSHASADKPAVERLAHKLRKAGVEPFLDKWHLIPGQPWQEALEEALHQSRTCAVFIGRELGPWQNEEMRSALETRVRDAGCRVIPVLLPGGRDPGKEELPRFLRRLTWVDFRGDLEDEEAFSRLLAGIRGKTPGPGSKPALPYRCMAPAREPFVQRVEYAKVRDALLVEADGSGRATTVGITTAIHGAGGFGKTALAIELCYDEQVRKRYPDGVLWTTMGEEIDDAGRLARVRDLIRWWTEEDPPAFETISAASAHLRKELEGKRVLLVIDDVWRPGDVTPFQGLASRAALLLTTRDSRTLPSESVPVHVDAMEIPEAVRMLGAGLSDSTGADLRSLATRLGEWPLLLKIVNRQLRELIQDDGLSLEQSLQEVNEALDAEGLTAFDREDLESRGQAVARTVNASLRRLSSEEVERFEQLAIFPEDKDVPLQVLEKLWGLGSFATKKLCGRLHDLSLLLRFDRREGTIRLHDVIRGYLVKRGESHLSEWNQRLLDAYRPANGNWADLPREERYLWSHLIHHLIGAGQSDVCRDLLLDFRYLSSKLGATDVNSLLADYSDFVEKDRELQLVRDALRLSAHVLTRNPAELRGQLLGRLLNRQDIGIRGLLQGSEESATPWLRPRIASLTRPGSVLIRTIHHPGLPNALAVLPGGRVVSASDDGTLRVWDVESGQNLQVLEGHSHIVEAVAVLDNHRVVSGSIDGTLRIWDVESGQTSQILQGHSHGVTAVATLDSHRVVSGSYEGSLRIWDVESGETLQILQPPSYRPLVIALAVLDDNRVVSASSDLLLRVWDVKTGQILQVLKGHSISLNSVAKLDGRRVVSGSGDQTLRVWDVERGEIIQILRGHSSSVIDLAILDNNRVVSASDDRTLRVWDVSTGQTLQILAESSYPVHLVAALDNHRLVSGSVDGVLRVWNLEGDQTLQTLEGHSKAIDAIAVFAPYYVVSCSKDETFRVWDAERGQILQTLEGISHSVKAMVMLDRRRAVFASSDWTLRVQDLESGQILQTLTGHSYMVNTLAVLDSHRIVSGSADQTLIIWDVESGQAIKVLKGHPKSVSAVAVLDSRRVVSACDDGMLRVWDVETGKILQTLKGHPDEIAVAILDSRRIVSASNDGTLWVLDVESGQILGTLEGHSDKPNAVAVLNSRWVVSASYPMLVYPFSSGTLRVWDVETGQAECLFTLDAPVTAIAALPGNRIIVAGDRYGRIHFFDFIVT